MSLLASPTLVVGANTVALAVQLSVLVVVVVCSKPRTTWKSPTRFSVPPPQPFLTAKPLSLHDLITKPSVPSAFVCTRASSPD